MSAGGWAGAGVICLALGLMLMSDAQWWRWLEYAGAACGLLATVQGWREWRDD